MLLSNQNARKTTNLNNLSQSNSHNRSPSTLPDKVGVPLFLQKSRDSTTGSPKPQNNSGLATAINHSKQGGSALPHHSRPRFESAFGSDLSGVRVHNGSQHNQLAKSIHAKAFTVGSDIFFAQGHYKPGTQDGDRLLAHELTHVMQQSSGPVQAKQVEPGLKMGEANDSDEQEADSVADRLVSTPIEQRPSEQHSIYSASTVSSGITPSDVIQRDEEEDQQGFNYNLMPPSLAYRNGGFGMSADTSAAQLSYFNNEGRANLGYQYGGDLFYSANMGGFRSRYGINPQSGVGSMSLGGSHNGFNFGVGGNTTGNFNLNLGYGAPLLPMPYMLSNQAGAAWQGASEVGAALPSMMDDPMALYRANRDNIGAMGAFGSSLGRIYGQQGQGGLPFGAGLSVSYNPEQRWVLGAGIQGSFP